MNLSPDNSPKGTNYHVVHQAKNKIKGTAGPLPDNPFDQLSNRSSRRVSTLDPLPNLSQVPCNSLLLHRRSSSFDDNLNDTYDFLTDKKRAQQQGSQTPRINPFDQYIASQLQAESLQPLQQAPTSLSEKLEQYKDDYATRNKDFLPSTSTITMSSCDDEPFKKSPNQAQYQFPHYSQYQKMFQSDQQFLNKPHRRVASAACNANAPSRASLPSLPGL